MCGFHDFVAFIDDPQHKATAQSREVGLRVRLTDAVANAGVFGAQRVQNELQLLRGALRPLFLEIDIDDDWSPSLKNLSDRYFDCGVRKFDANGKVPLPHQGRSSPYEPKDLFR
jgi:hypothetical protein